MHRSGLAIFIGIFVFPRAFSLPYRQKVLRFGLRILQ
ncbi:unnamed protein product [Callosobruchus maculatus]|uniref:Uncharacterized protein n=1 Tax=Callosobruchus maculatus TaxID=64391 RepID=A0A653BUD7_CALMS|nr:unnamed protein product [Callosobruchus maculatus]